jgi:hypothetical protein
LIERAGQSDVIRAAAAGGIKVIALWMEEVMIQSGYQEELFSVGNLPGVADL